MADWIAPAGGNTYLNTSQRRSNAQLVANHFIATGWHPNSIAAMCGNMSHESTLNPNLYEQGYNHSPSRGYGLVQWTPATKLWDWCNKRSLDWSNGDSQLSRIDYEIDNGIQWIANGHQKRYHKGTKYDFSFKQFRSNSVNLSVAQLTEAFMWNYEGPAYWAGTGSLDSRQAFAQWCADNLDWSGSGVVIPNDEYYFIYPTTTHNVTSGFKTPERPDHYGIDLADGTVQDIMASAAGTVTRSEFSSSYGEVVYLLHNIQGEEYESVYAHMVSGSRTVNVGDTVTQGQKLGVMGNTGDSEGLHLHFEIHKPRWTATKENAIDPLPLLGTMVVIGDPNDPKTNPDPDFLEKDKLYVLLLTDSLNGWKY